MTTKTREHLLLAAALISCIAALLMVPEVRIFLGLQKSPDHRNGEGTGPGEQHNDEFAAARELMDRFFNGFEEFMQRLENAPDPGEVLAALQDATRETRRFLGEIEPHPVIIEIFKSPVHQWPEGLRDMAERYHRWRDSMGAIRRRVEKFSHDPRVPRSFEEFEHTFHSLVPPE